MQRRAALGAGLGERERAGGELEPRQRDALRRLAARVEPAQASGDHQMEDEKQIGFESEDDALAEPANAAHALAFGFRDRGNGGAQHERIVDAHVREGPTGNPRRERVAIHRDVGQFRHYALKPALSCEPSQKGFVREKPQRQSNVVSPAAVRPSAPITVSGPRHSRGPSSVGVIVTSPGIDIPGGASTGSSPGSEKPIRVCVPSQNGLSRDRPQRHSTSVGGVFAFRAPASNARPDTMYGP